MSFHRSFLIHRAFSHDGWTASWTLLSWPWRRRSMLLWSGAAMALRARVAPVLPLLWLTGVWRCLCGWIACCAIVAHRGCSMDWIGNISKWALWTVETLGWESNCFVARGGRDVELVVSRAAIWSTCCSCFSCCSWWLHRSVLGCRSGCDAAHATWSFERHAGIACERVACDVVMSAGGTAAAPSCQVHDCAGCWQAAPVSNPARARQSIGPADALMLTTAMVP